MCLLLYGGSISILTPYTHILESAVLVGLRNYIPDDDLVEVETSTKEISVK